MTSELRVDKIHNEGGDNDSGIDLSTNDQIVLKTANTTRLTMNATGQTTIVGEGGSTTTSVQQGIAKCWGKADGDASTVVFFDSFNLSGVTDNGTGNYTFAINNDMASIHYSLHMSGDMGSGSGGFNGAGGITAGTYQFYAYTYNGSFRDLATAYSTVHGDLA